MKPVVLDAFCGQGGAAMGYHLAGFDVIGFDNKPQPRYPFDFILADALEVLADPLRFIPLGHRRRVAFVHASPPCQKFSRFRSTYKGKPHPDLIAPSRDLLERLGCPWTIENVPDAPLVDPVRLCGSSFGLGCAGLGRELRRHRHFESNWPLRGSVCNHRLPVVGVYGHGGHHRLPTKERGGFQARADEAREAMGMPWASRDGCAQAIPPAYTLFIGRQLREHLGLEEAAA
jgi:DNA (cytosine-5)-methyltransferase 1